MTIEVAIFPPAVEEPFIFQSELTEDQFRERIGKVINERTFLVFNHSSQSPLKSRRYYFPPKLVEMSVFAIGESNESK